MFTLSSDLKFHLFNQPTDMRKSFDGLSGVVKNILNSNPCNGDVFIFINKTRDKIKLLHWQGSGFTLYYKRLEEGRYSGANPATYSDDMLPVIPAYPATFLRGYFMDS